MCAAADRSVPVTQPPASLPSAQALALSPLERSGHTLQPSLQSAVGDYAASVPSVSFAVEESPGSNLRRQEGIFANTTDAGLSDADVEQLLAQARQAGGRGSGKALTPCRDVFTHESDLTCISRQSCSLVA